MPKVGLLYGRERAFASALTQAIPRADARVGVEPVTVDCLRMATPPATDVLFDQISYTVPAVQSVLKNAALCGATVVNDPFFARADDRFVDFALAAAHGVPVANAMLLPNWAHVEGVVDESLRNRAEPLSWAAALDALRWPVVMKPVDRRGEADATVLWSADDVWHAWSATGTSQVLLQEYVAPSESLRVFVAGAAARAVAWDAAGGRVLAAGVRDVAAARRAEADAVTLAIALGQRVAAVDVAVRDGEPLVVDTHGHVPAALAPETLGDDAFAWLVGEVAGLLAGLAVAGAPPRYRWTDERPLPRPR
jgi:hypothetical protein